MREDTAMDLARWAQQRGQLAGACTFLGSEGQRAPAIAVETVPGLVRVTVDQGTARKWVGLS